MPRKVLKTASSDLQEDGSVQVEVMLSVSQRRRESAAPGRHRPESNSSVRPRIPRITRLMALAIKFQEMVDRGEVRDYADLGRLGYVSRARITQIMNLLLLAPDIQEHVLFEIQSNGSTEKALRAVCTEVCWSEQRLRFGR